ncbi:MAG: glycosyltransferase family 39 protein [Clostridiaceae bacterium]|nr:glycosyltransferase family 39 protein [Clostridiaceae bacterium]
MIRNGKTLIYTGLILGIALYLRLRFIIYAPFEFKIDAWSMYNYALNVMGGEYYGHSFGDHWSRYAYWPPLYIFLSGFVYRFFGTAQNFLVMRVIQACLSAASCLICSSIAREALKDYSSLNEEAGLAAGILMALNPRMVVYSNHLYVETVFITIYLSAVYFCLRYFKSEMSPKLSHTKGYASIRHLILFSILLGLGNLTRPVLLLLPAVMLVSALFFITAKRLSILRGIKLLTTNLTITLLVMFAVLSPWIIRNYALTGRLILIDTNGPVNFCIAHNPNSNGTWVDIKKPEPDMYKLYETGYKEGLVYIRNNVSREIELLSTKQQLFFYHGDYHISEAKVYLDKTYRLPLYESLIKMGIGGLPQMSFEFLWKSALILLVLFILRLISHRSLFILFCEPAWIIGNFLYMNLIILIFYYAPRYRVPAEPFLCILIGIFLAGVLHIQDDYAD